MINVSYFIIGRSNGEYFTGNDTDLSESQLFS